MGALTSSLWTRSKRNSNSLVFIFLIIAEHNLPVRCLNYDENTNRFISASDDMHINIYDAESFSVITPLVGHSDIISCLDYNLNANLLASASFDGTIKLWDIRSGKSCVQSLDVKKYLETDNKDPLLGEDSSVWDVAFSGAGDNIICGSERRSLIFTSG